MKLGSVMAGVVLGMVTTWVGAAETPGTAPEASLVCKIKVLPDKAPDCSSLKSIVETVTRDCKNNDEKMMAIDNFMRISHYHRQYPPSGPALLWFNNYGWSLCGGLAGLQSSLYSQIPGWGWRHIAWPGHNMSEAFYDGSWHWVDCFLKFHAWRPDPKAPNGRTIASQDDLAANPDLVNEAVMLDPVSKVAFDKNDRREMIKGQLNWTAPVLLTCGDELDGIMGGVNSRRIDGENAPNDGWKPEAYSAEINLLPGFSLENTWDALATPEESWPVKDGQTAGHTCPKNRDLRNDPAAGPVLEPYFKRSRSYGNGRVVFAPDFGNAEILKSFAAVENVKVEGGALVPNDPAAPASVTVRMESPYVMVKINGSIAGDEVSVAGLKLENGVFTMPVPGFSQSKQQVKIDIRKRLTALRVEAIVMNNPGALPFLSPGKNAVTVSVADPKALGSNKLVVTYAYQPGYRTKTFEQLFDEGKNLFSQDNASWSEAPTVVQKTFAAGDLPATFEINVPTPKGKYPVYPRMLFVRREVVPVNAQPLPLPPNAEAPKSGSGYELATLPNPFLIGAQPPAGHVEPARTTNVVATLGASHAVCITGETAANHFIRWPPDNKAETWIMLVGGEIKGLPDSKEIAKATLAIPVVRGKPKAATRVCVVKLKAPFEAGKPCDFANLGETIGTVIVPRQDGPDYNPPKLFRADITPYVKQLARGEVKFSGLAIRVQQDRGVDEGYLIRIDMPDAARLPLEIETLVKTP